jgi:ABC-type histidine transport system ATPase subunit
MSESAIRLRDVHKRFGPTPIILGVSLDIAAGSGTRSSARTARARPRCST